MWENIASHGKYRSETTGCPVTMSKTKSLILLGNRVWDLKGQRSFSGYQNGLGAKRSTRIAHDLRSYRKMILTSKQMGRLHARIKQIGYQRLRKNSAVSQCSEPRRRAYTRLSQRDRTRSDVVEKEDGKVSLHHHVSLHRPSSNFK